MTQQLNYWKMVKVKDVISDDITLFNKSKYQGNFIRYIDISSVDNVSKTISDAKQIDKNKAPSRAKSILKEDDIIISTVRPNLNAVARVPKEYEGCVASSGFSIVRLKPGYSPCYFFLYFTSPFFIDMVNNLIQGAMYPAISNNDIKNATLPLPKNYEEQKKIAMTTITKINATHMIRNIAIKQEEAVNALQNSILREAFPFKMGDTLPSGWKWATIDDVTRDITDGTHYTPRYVEDGIPFLSVTNIRRHGIYFDKCKYITEEEHKILNKRCNPEVGDVLYTKVGTTGIAKVVDTDRPFSLFVSVALLKIKDDYDPYYIETVLNSPFCKQQADDKTQGIGNQNLVLDDIKDIIFAIPIDKNEQSRICNEIRIKSDNYYQLKDKVKIQKEAVKALPLAILKQTFAFN